MICEGSSPNLKGSTLDLLHLGFGFKRARCHLLLRGLDV